MYTLHKSIKSSSHCTSSSVKYPCMYEAISIRAAVKSAKAAYEES